MRPSSSNLHLRPSARFLRSFGARIDNQVAATQVQRSTQQNRRRVDMGKTVRPVQTLAFAASETSIPTLWLTSTVLLLITSSCYGTPRTSVPKGDAGGSDAADAGGGDAADAVGIDASDAVAIDSTTHGDAT